MTQEPNKANIRLFVDALRSGDYQQGNNVLGYTEAGVDKFCCLGVATEVAIKHGVPLARVIGDANGRTGVFIYTDGIPESSDTKGIYLHPLVRDFYGFDSYNPETNVAAAGVMNDEHHMPFGEIADAFEVTYLADTAPADTGTHGEED